MIIFHESSANTNREKFPSKNLKTTATTNTKNHNNYEKEAPHAINVLFNRLRL